MAAARWPAACLPAQPAASPPPPPPLFLHRRRRFGRPLRSRGRQAPPGGSAISQRYDLALPLLRSGEVLPSWSRFVRSLLIRLVSWRPAMRLGSWGLARRAPMRVLAAAPIDSVAILCLRRVKFYEESSWCFDVKSLRPAVSSNFRLHFGLYPSQG